MSLRRFVDAVVIGAGPAGTAFARTFAASGRSVLVVDRSAPGRSVVCGGFLGPEIAEAVSAAGLARMFDALPKNPVRTVVVSSPLFGATSVSFGSRAAYAVDRAQLGQAMIDEAGSAGTRFLFHASILSARRFSGFWKISYGGPDGIGEVVSRFLVRTDGRRPPAPSSGEPFFACRTVYEDSGVPEDRVQLHFIRRGHVGLNPLGGGKALICFHADGRYLKEARGDVDRLMSVFAEQNPALTDLLRSARRVEEWKSCAAEPDGLKIFFENGTFHAGDAVTMIHPVVGGGIPVAVESGALLAAHLSANGAEPERAAALYADSWRSRFGGREAAAEWLGRAERSETAAKIVFSFLRAAPALLSGIVSRTRA